MLANKAEAAFQLLQLHAEKLTVPDYIRGGTGMDKRVIFAVAGSGKTTLLIRRLREDRRTLILTFTVNNEAHLRAQIIRRFGYIPYGSV